MFKSILEEFIKSGGVLLGVILVILALGPLLRHAVGFHLNLRKVKLSQIKMLFEALDLQLNCARDAQRLNVEQSFQLVFKKSVDFDVVKVLLRHRNPTEAIKRYLKGRYYLKLDKVSDRIVLKSDYGSVAPFGVKVYFTTLRLYLAYFLFGGVAGALLLVSMYYFNVGNLTQSFIFMLPALFFGTLALVFLCKRPGNTPVSILV